MVLRDQPRMGTRRAAATSGARVPASQQGSFREFRFHAFSRSVIRYSRWSAGCLSRQFLSRSEMAGVSPEPYPDALYKGRRRH